MFRFALAPEKIKFSHLHVNVDSVDPGNAKVDLDGMTSEDVAVELGLSGLRVLGVEELDQAPVLYHALRHSNLE